MTELSRIPCKTHSGVPTSQLRQLEEDDERAPTPDMWHEDEHAAKGTREARRRRWAIQHCQVDCPTEVRLRCALLGLKEAPWTGLMDGVWGGYTKSQRRAIAREATENGVDLEVAIRRMISASRQTAPPTTPTED